MTCHQFLDLVEAIAAGDIDIFPEARHHLETCPRCARALAVARRVEAALQVRPAPAAPPRFTPAVLASVRRQRWQAEQNVDRVFNVAIVAALLIILSGVATLTNVDAVLAISTRAAVAVNDLARDAASQAAPTLSAYAAAAALLVSALGMWWWAERRLSL